MQSKHKPSEEKRIQYNLTALMEVNKAPWKETPRKLTVKSRYQEEKPLNHWKRSSLKPRQMDGKESIHWHHEKEKSIRYVTGIGGERNHLQEKHPREQM